MDDNKIVQLKTKRNNIPLEANELIERLARMRSSYLELIAVQILDVVLQQASIAQMSVNQTEESLYDVALVKEAILAMLARVSGMDHKLHAFAEQNFSVEIDEEFETIHTHMIDKSEDKIEETEEDIASV